jgi:subfamily B ATP-binding cassette protein MsbA
VQAGFNFLRTYLLGLVGEGVVADVRRGLFDHLLGLSTRFFEERKVGEITSRLTSDITTLQGAVSQALAQFVGQLITLLGGVVVLFWLNAQLTLVILAVVPLIVIAAAFFGRYLRSISTAFQDSVAHANASAEQALAAIRVVKSFTAEQVESRRYGDEIRQSFVLARRRVLARALFIPSVGLALFSGISVVLWYGGRQVLLGALAPGDLVAFLILTITVAASVGTFTGLYSQLQEAMGASKRIFELFDTESDLKDPAGPAPLPAVRGEVVFEDVSFSYGDRGDTPVLQDISLRAEPGRAVALVGPSGAGKSSLVMLIPRFFDPVAGRILLDGRDLRSISLRELRSQVGVVFQETLLFSGTVRDNIRYGDPAASDKEVVSAAEAANAAEFIAAFPDGYDTIVGERGVKLSGGQRQRIAIARALLKNPRILILDEATSSLDSESEALVQAALDRLMQGRTTFVIAHRLSTIVAADQILVIEQGRIVQRGTHQELLAESGLYRQLYDRQFRSVREQPGTPA